jgi:hypothetical protein
MNFYDLLLAKKLSGGGGGNYDVKGEVILDGSNHAAGVKLFLNIPDGATEITSSAFASKNIISATIPASVTKINNYAFRYCNALESITCFATTPPTLTSNSFANTNATFKIYVPAESVDDYKAASYWSNRADYIEAIPN